MPTLNYSRKDGKMEILALGGHPDDMEQFAGGTLALLARDGHQVTIVPVTSGECGSHELDADAIVTIRQKEAPKAAEILGAKYRCLNIQDGCVSYDLETAKKFVGLIREIAPDIIITHPTVDYMTDHSHTGQLVLWAVPEAGHENFPANTKAPAIKKQPYVYHVDPEGLVGMDGQIVRVSTIVDISEVIDQKMEAFSAHKSQMGFPADEEETKQWAVIRGRQVGVGYGEGFTQQQLDQYPKQNILRELLGQKVVTL